MLGPWPSVLAGLTVDGLFELADVWSPLISAVAYAQFLWTLLAQVAEGTAPDQCKPLQVEWANPWKHTLAVYIKEHMKENISPLDAAVAR